RVLDVATVKVRSCVNFGSDWRTDITITVQPPDRRRFVKCGDGPGSLRGRLVRVRGWLRWRNGPMIEATHPEQIDVL
ncbi:MAG: thermonuclease family protein, partial [Pseudomonadota bacterium]|nr:thermonuclease family protein [Pseudomonadota bacterium]